MFQHCWTKTRLKPRLFARRKLTHRSRACVFVRMSSSTLTRVSDGGVSGGRWERRAGSRSAQRLLSLLRISVTGGLLWLLLRKVTLAEVVEVVQTGFSRWPLLAMAFLLPLFSPLVYAMRWRMLLSVHGVTTRIPRLWEAILVGNYYNQFFPSTIGGDVMRSWWIAQRNLPPPAETASSPPLLLSLTVVAVDRLFGVAGIYVTALVAALISPLVLEQAPSVWGALAFITFGLGAGVAVAVVIAKSERVRTSLFRLGSLGAKLVKSYHALAAYRGRRDLLAGALTWSVLLQGFIVLQYCLIARALQLPVPITCLALIVPVVTLVSLAPITINGIGVRENALALLAAPFGLSAGGAAVLAFSVLSIALIHASLGGLVQLRGFRCRRFPDDQTDTTQKI